MGWVASHSHFGEKNNKNKSVENFHRKGGTILAICHGKIFPIKYIRNCIFHKLSENFFQKGVQLLRMLRILDERFRPFKIMVLELELINGCTDC